MKVLVKYLGQKTCHADDLFGSHKVWSGHGDVQLVNDEVAERMADTYPTIYAIVQAGDDAPKVVPAGVETDLLHTTMVIEELNGQEVALIDASRLTVAKHATETLGIQIGDGHTKTEILKFIADYEEVKDKSTGTPDPDPVPTVDAKDDPLVAACLTFDEKPSAAKLKKAAKLGWRVKVLAADRDAAWEKAEVIRKAEAAPKEDEKPEGEGTPDPDPNPAPGDGLRPVEVDLAEEEKKKLLEE